jgi:AraC-like DNA-binding protein
MVSVTFPQWQGFELAPEGHLLDQFIDLEGPMGIAYERSVEFYKDFHTHDRLMFVFPRGSSSMDVRTRGPRGEHSVDSSSILTIPEGLVHDDEGTSAIYDTMALYPSVDLLRRVSKEEGLAWSTVLAFTKRTVKVRRSPWLDQLLVEYFSRRILARQRSSEALNVFDREIILAVLRQAGVCEERREASSQDPGTVADRAIQFLETNLFLPIEMKDAARHCHASLSTLLRHFREKTGKTPYQYVKDRRLDEAARLLQQDRYAVSEVAALVGYEDFSAFSTAFKRKFGRPPSAMKKRVAS